MSENMCLCGSCKPQSECHADINGKSLVAKLYRLQQDIDNEMEKYKNGKFRISPCKEGYCRSCGFCVSEAEFVQILNYLLRHWSFMDIQKLIEKSHLQWKQLQENDPEYAQKLTGTITIYDLYKMNDRVLPFPCIFLDENGFCKIYPLRPLQCRFHSVGCTSDMPSSKPCSDLPQPESDPSLNELGLKALQFIFYKYHAQTIIRRPVPLFYYFHLIFKDMTDISSMHEIEFYKNMLQFSEEDYVSYLVDSSEPH